MKPEARDTGTAPSGHVVQFYEDVAELSQAVGGELATAIQTGSVAVVIATERHWRALAARLAAAGIDAAQAVDDGRLVHLDAEQTLAKFRANGRLDREAFRAVVGSVIRAAAADGRPVWAFGEMVAVLWDEGDVLAAIELEALWNDLGRELSFSLWCAYRRSSVSDPAQAEALQEVCRLHSDVVEPTGRPGSNVTEVTGRFTAGPHAPGAARDFLADALRRWGHSGALVDDAKLVISELATNAVIHARSAFSVTARSEASGLRLSVSDASMDEPRLSSDGHAISSGHGLRVVAALASRWGVEPGVDGKTVWAELG